MESSDSGTGVADCSVGAIVWVRRRNGSWWPGKILGPDELSASHLMSPRSGTPVKLLGREDASVDWYNLEKSKRVKAFRCGEFDDCIERAEASQGIPPKKRDKYARREDAILHALELEKQLLEKKYGELGCSSNGASSVKKELATSAEGLGCGNRKNLKSHQNSKGVDSSLENKSKAHQHLHDNSDVLPRMKGLQDIGPRVKHKLSSSVALNGSQKPTLVDSAKNPPNGDQSTENNILVSSKISLDKRKRSNEGVVEESLVKRRDRRRPLVQVLESSAKLPVPRSLNRDDGHVSPSISGERKTDVECNAKRSKYAYLTAQSSGCLEDKEIHSVKMEIVHSKFEESNSPPHRAALSEENRSGSTEDTETDTSETDSVESDTDETIGTLSDDSAPIELIPKSMGRPEAQGEQECMSDEEPDDFALISEQYPNSPISASVGGVSKWQIKGKRNNRGVTKRLAGKNLSQGSSRRGTLKGTESYGYDETESIHNNLGTQMAGYGSSGPPGVNRSIIDWDELAWNDEPTLKGYWVDSNEYYDPMFVGGRIDPMLIDVDLKVQSSYQREHVPMISLMSKLNGKAIVGHPIPVETLDNGSTEALLGAPDSFWPEPEMVDQDTTLPPVWRTARRTANCRVPRPQGSRSRMDRKFTKKPAKKMSLSSSPKIRALSSIGMPHKHGSNKSYHQVDGLIKQESAAPTVVACIPVKLVFSRLHEALVGRHQ